MTNYTDIDPNYRGFNLPEYKLEREITSLKQEIQILTYENRKLREELLKYISSNDVEDLIY